MTPGEILAQEIPQAAGGRERELFICLMLREIAYQLANLVQVSLEAENQPRPG